MLPLFSPDGRMCAFVRDNNIWLKKFDYDTETPVTKDGSDGKILNGMGSWVYEEEFGANGLMSWSPDSKILAFVKSDETEVPAFGFRQFDGTAYPPLKQFKYPKAGEKNPSVSVHAYNVATKDIKKMNLPVAPDDYIPMIKFTSRADQLAVMTLNRQQTLFRMYYSNPKSAISRMILKDESPFYIQPEYLNSIYFTETHFTYISESDGYAHIYLYGPTGILQKQLTSGSWDVMNLRGIDPATLTVYYESAEESPLRRALYSIDGKGKKKKLSSGTGFNQASFNSNCTYYINTYSKADVPDRVSCCDREGKEMFVLSDNTALQSALQRQKTVPKEFFTITTDTDHELNAWMIKPLHFDASEHYPAVMLQYNGPASQQVLDKYDMGWEQYLAARGFVVICVDGRGTGARGETFRKCTTRRLGILESDDQIAAARYAGRLPFVDKRRIAIWGWSYGATVALLSMSNGNTVFKAGIAIAPVTDWKLYDTAYTERYMRTPNENPDGYRQSSPITFADQLWGKLLLIHGTSDDNVHLQNTLYYSKILVDSGKQFDMQLYTGKNHNIAGNETRLHLYKKCVEFLERELKK
jgi:dipeptidyl-peptidase-4